MLRFKTHILEKSLELQGFVQNKYKESTLPLNCLNKEVSV